ncbi:MAG: type I restriction enzyme HsdR N-terminal domain-containing protein [Bacteroidales bacterium]|nr:type I restriction enzyme HsdR N-terminal domain-containing protein [Bacteroidales bacterium]
MSRATTAIETRLRDGRDEVFDPCRRRWVALTPEEWVRQNVIRRLHLDYSYPLEVMQVEGTIEQNGMSRRCDIVVYNRQGLPWMIVECKRDTVPLTQSVCDQACRYNRVLQVPYLVLTNGRSQVVMKVDFAQGQLLQLSDIPHYEA